MKVAIIGAGALGCLFGAKFSKNNEVILITHGSKSAEAINKNGVYIKEGEEETIYHQNIKAYATGECNQVVDVAVILVKTTQTQEALQQNLKIIGKDTIVLTLQNGLGNQEVISEYVDDKQLILGTTNHNSVLLENNKIFHSGAGITSIGGVRASKENIEKIYNLFISAGFECQISENIGYLLWRKLFINLTINSFTYITLTPIGFISQNSYALEYVKKIISEAVAVAKAEGYDFDEKEVVKTVNDVSAAHPKGYSSMSQDRKKGVKTEIDSINGAVVKLAQKHNILTPYNELVVNLVHAIEAGDAYNQTLS